MKPRLEEYYKQTVKSELMNELQCQNIMEVPEIQKVIVNMGLGEAINDKNILNKASEELALITGQKPVTTKARKSVAGFKIRKNWPIGCKVTLRRKSMYNFLDKLISVAIPRIKDFRGFSDKAFDGRGNYTLGIQEQIVFPEIEYDKIDSIRGMDITIVTTANNDEQGKLLLQKFNFPFKS